MKTRIYHYLLLVFLISFTLSCNNKEEPIIEPEPEEEENEVPPDYDPYDNICEDYWDNGYFNVADSTLPNFVYAQFDSVIFVDVDSQFISFSIIPIDEERNYITSPEPCDADSIYYYYERSEYSYNLISDDTNIEFYNKVTCEVQNQEQYVADLNLISTSNLMTADSMLVGKMILDYRTYSYYQDDAEFELISDFQIGNTIYENVYRKENPQQTIYYNTEFGIIRFENDEGIIWNLDRLE